PVMLLTLFARGRFVSERKGSDQAGSGDAKAVPKGEKGTSVTTAGAPEECLAVWSDYRAPDHVDDDADDTTDLFDVILGQAHTRNLAGQELIVPPQYALAYEGHSLFHQQCATGQSLKTRLQGVIYQFPGLDHVPKRLTVPFNLQVAARHGR